MSKIKNFWPIILIVLLAITFFWRFFFKGLLPIPADITVGMYFPWLDYKWGYAVGVPVKNPLISDVVSQVYPWRISAIELLKQKEIPLWNPYSFFGYPLLANITTAVFYPLNILYFLFSEPTAWSLIIFMQVLLSLLFMHLYLSNIGVSSPASIIGALSFAFSGFMMTKLEWSTGGQAGMWLPLLLLLIDKIIKNPSLLKIFFGSLVLATINLAGHFQVPVYVLIFSFIYIFFRIITLKNKENVKVKVLSLLLVLVFGIGIAAPQLLPTLELYKLSIREGEGYLTEYNFGLLPFKHLITFLAPDFYGHPATMNYRGFWNYHEMTGYFGLIPLIFAFWAFFLRRDKQTIFFLVLALIVLSFILPTPWAKIPYIFSFPAIGTSAATRLFFLLGFLGSTLAALGADFIFRNWQKTRKKFFKQIIFVFLILLGITIGVLISFLIYRKALFLAESETVFYQLITQEKNKMVVSLRNLVIPWGLFLSFSFLFAIGHLMKKNKVLFLVFWFGTIFLIVFDLFRFGWKYNPFISKDLLFPLTPVLEFLQNQKKPFRILSEDVVIPSNMWISYGLESPVGYDPLYPKKTAEFLAVVNGGTINSPLSRYGNIQNFKSPLLNLGNVKYILAVKRDEQNLLDSSGEVSYKLRLPKFKPVFDDKSVRVLENEEVLPRAFMVYKYRIVSDETQIINNLLSTDFNMSQEIILEKKIGRELTKGEIKRVEYKKNNDGSVSVIVDHSGNGLLFVSDSFYPGWRAFIGNQETPIYRANFAFRAVFVPNGSYIVRFIYDPQSFKIGAAISLITLAILGGILVYETKNRLQASV